MYKNKVIVLFLLMLIGHVAHVFEEVWGRFWILDRIGPGKYLSINLALFCIPVLLFYFILNEKRWAYILGIVYAGFMALQGIGHNVATIITGKYFDGFAGGYTGIGLAVIGSALMYFLVKQVKTR
ncbi:MAG: hypothetical protein ABSG89_10345 [Bacteroidales bacterium]|jgi:hypothetical protein